MSRQQRLALRPPAELVDRHGNVVGKLYSLTVALGDLGGSSSAEQNDNDPQDGGPGEGAQPLVPPTERELLSFRNTGGAPAHLLRAAVDFVWAHYVAVMESRNTIAGDDERKMIREALKVATVEECCRAISGCRASEWHMGANDRRRKYNQLSQILRGKRGRQTARERIDFFLEIAEKNPGGASVASAEDARVQQAKRDVLTAHEFPGDEHAQQAANEAAEWLTENGWRVVRDEDGARPRFEPMA